MDDAAVSVLMFEDDAGQALVTREALEREGFTVETGRTGHEGLARAQDHAYQVVLIDMRMPDLYGTEILRRIRQINPDAVTIIVTGHGDQEIAVEAMKQGANDYVVKSPDMSHLSTLPLVIREGLERRRLQRQQVQLQGQIREHARLLEERNKELSQQNVHLDRMNKIMIDREERIIELKRQVNALLKELGRPPEHKA